MQQLVVATGVLRSLHPLRLSGPGIPRPGRSFARPTTSWGTWRAPIVSYRARHRVRLVVGPGVDGSSTGLGQRADLLPLVGADKRPWRRIGARSAFIRLARVPALFNTAILFW